MTDDRRVTENRVLIDAAAFMDSARARDIGGASSADVRAVVQRFLAACYDDLATEPRFLDGDGMAALLREALPRQFAVRDRLAGVVEEVLTTYLAFLVESTLVSNAFEQRKALDDHMDAFLAAVESGAAHADGVAVTRPLPRTTRGYKVGRNDPCPCGSGKKFKKCCQGLGG